MIVGGILLYLLATIAIGWWAGRRVKDADDFLLAGRSLGFTLATATVFATWFGAESVLGSAGRVANEGFLGTITEPIGAALCLLLMGLVFAVPIYRRRLLTLGDLYRQAYGHRVETVASTMMILSFLGWVAGQFVALGLLMEVLMGIPMQAGIVIAFVIVTGYTMWGGMWSIAILDLVQNAVIIAGMAGAAIWLYTQADWAGWQQRLPEGFTSFTPVDGGAVQWLNWLAALITIGLGSIPGQDVYQRVMSSRSELVARRSALLAGVLYLVVGAVPVAMAIYFRLHQPALVGIGMPEGTGPDPQAAIPSFVLQQWHPLLALLFLGALVSAILSTASGALLAPSAILSENILRRIWPQLSGRQLLRTSRLAVVGVSAASLALALGGRSIHELVAESSALSLVSLFCILVAALFFRRVPGPRTAMASMVAGFGCWLAARLAETALEPLLFGLTASALALLAGWLLERNQMAKPDAPEA